MNCVPGAGRGDGAVDTPLGRVACAARAAPGTAVTLGMRPEHITAEPDGAVADSIDGVLRARTFLGETTALQVEAGGLTPVAQGRRAPTRSVGQPGRLPLPRAAARVVAP